MNNSNKYNLNSSQVAHSFNHAAQNYDNVALLQREVGNRVTERLQYIKLAPKCVLDVGMGTGVVTEKLCQQFPHAEMVGLDIAENMLKVAAKADFESKPQHYICADVNGLPFAENSFDLIFSNLALHWCSDLFITMNELQRVLKPGGLLIFSSLGPDTLKELRESWKAVDHYPHVNSFTDMHDVGDVILEAGLADPVMDMEYISLSYMSVRDVMLDLKTLGAHNLTQGRKKSLTGKNALQKMEQAYEQFRDEAGRLPLTYEIIHGHAWGKETASSVNAAGDVEIPLSSLKRK